MFGFGGEVEGGKKKRGEGRGWRWMPIIGFCLGIARRKEVLLVLG